jgi:hypothetical protein
MHILLQASSKKFQVALRRWEAHHVNDARRHKKLFPLSSRSNASFPFDVIPPAPIDVKDAAAAFKEQASVSPKMCSTRNHSSAIQGTFGTIQGTFGTAKGTFGTIQITFRLRRAMGTMPPPHSKSRRA